MCNTRLLGLPLLAILISSLSSRIRHHQERQLVFSIHDEFCYMPMTIGITIQDQIHQKGCLMAKSNPKNEVSEKAILKMKAFVEKMGSVDKAKEALETLNKIRNAA